ncbi:MAG: biliverdin-producing heme oxygenase [Bacteriovorax sp.]|nr:biliverdin-producing heme oxygenase [Rhizobacter sp.]
MKSAPSERLRSETRTLHAQAERKPIMPSLLRGEVHEPSCTALLSNLLAICAVPAPVLDRHSQHPSLSWIAASARRRAATLRADLSARPGGVLRAEGVVVPAALAYVKRPTPQARCQQQRRAGYSSPHFVLPLR